MPFDQLRPGDRVWSPMMGYGTFVGNSNSPSHPFTVRFDFPAKILGKSHTVNLTTDCDSPIVLPVTTEIVHAL